jgi:hypothetical protein
LHLHIPRTGGISAGRGLAAALGGREIIRSNKRSDVVAALERGADVGLVSGHFPWGLHELFPEHVYFTALRDPVERSRSLYDYIRVVTVHPRHKLFSAHSLEELLRKPKERRFFSNGQVRQIGAWQRGLEPMSASIMERAWENLCRENAVVTFTDKIDEGLRLLSGRIGRPIPPHRKTMNKAQRSPIKDGVLDDLRSLNEFDIELYRRAREKFAPLLPAGPNDISNATLGRPSATLIRSLKRLLRKRNA